MVADERSAPWTASNGYGIRNSLKNPENDLFFLLQYLLCQENGREMAADVLQSTMVEAIA